MSAAKKLGYKRWYLALAWAPLGLLAAAWLLALFATPSGWHLAALAAASLALGVAQLGALWLHRSYTTRSARLLDQSPIKQN